VIFHRDTGRRVGEEVSHRNRVKNAARDRVGCGRTAATFAFFAPATTTIATVSGCGVNFMLGGILALINTQGDICPSEGWGEQTDRRNQNEAGPKQGSSETQTGVMQGNSHGNRVLTLR
jgi:hypothetical protein